MEKQYERAGEISIKTPTRSYFRLLMTVIPNLIAM